jgi:hypothetical protein
MTNQQSAHDLIVYSCPAHRISDNAILHSNTMSYFTGSLSNSATHTIAVHTISTHTISTHPIATHTIAFHAIAANIIAYIKLTIPFTNVFTDSANIFTNSVSFDCNKPSILPVFQITAFSTSCILRIRHSRRVRRSNFTLVGNFTHIFAFARIKLHEGNTITV